MEKNRVLRIILAMGFTVMGILHFVAPEGFLKIMPPFLPFHRELVYLSGLFEILGGLGLLFKSTRKIAGWSLIALLIAVFPANIYMAFKNIQFDTFKTPEWALWLRLPFQFLFIFLVWKAGELRFKKGL
ncbi:MAG: DoxX family protein [Bacteroidota bacterium]